MSAPRTLLVTGANGFVGRALVTAAAVAGWRVRAATRRGEPVPGAAECCAVGDLGPDTDWAAAVAGCQAVVHLAAKVHCFKGVDRAEYDRANVEASIGLARAASAAGVKRLVFVSTVKVLGEGRERPYTDADVPAPVDVYAQSKLEAERQMLAVSSETGLEVVNLRPPLVYGPGVKANFLSMLDKIDQGWPLPLGGLKTRRSFCYLDNLVDAILFVLEHVEAPGRAFLVADSETIALPEFVRRLAKTMGKPARLWTVSPSLLKWVGALIGRAGTVARITDSLEVDCAGLRALGWRQPVALDEALAKTVDWYRKPSDADRHSGP